MAGSYAQTVSGTRALLEFVPPMLLRAGQPSLERSGEYAVEVKWDGMRLQFASCAQGWCARSRPGRLCSDEFPELEDLAKHLDGRSVVFDGELVVFDKEGRPDFAALRRRLVSRRPAEFTDPAVFVAFDMLSLDGESVQRMPYLERRALLSEVLQDGPRWRVPRHFTGDLEACVTATIEHGLEGVVYKRLDSSYEPGRRSTAWLKRKNRRTETLAVCGYQPARAGVDELDTYYLARALPDGKLQRVGGLQFGLSPAERARLRAAVAKRALPERRRRIVDVADGVQVEVSFHGGANGPLRDPVIAAVSVD